ncbi:hypothetical protein [Chondromyces apiculatus]|uniref:Peptidase S1 domain-containing protein n=1 Tax=Chondromyces apiculatus DSM 436 TaxID=1192034 RepID=A0A017T752_9BACT|nr:hypothetical protein [Chondromyces apiculatus]EYF05034.1 Hypothetical protein CAP_3624 [Chondromyces apiculatus DSM 436]
MILTAEGVEKATQDLIEDLDPDHYGLCEAMAVKLEGGVASGSFTGSGVVFRIDLAAGRTYVLTAKHNLHIAAKRANLGSSGLSAYFRTKVRVKVPGISSQEYAIAGITLCDGSDADFRYDVCLVQVDSMPLARAVNDFLRVGFRGEFASAKARSGGLGGDPQDKQIWDVLTNDAAQRVLGNKYGYKDYTLLQFGFGKIEAGDMASYGFRKRAISLKPEGNVARVVREYIPRTHEGYQDVFVFPGTDTSTGAPGDSGGPVFALDATRTKSFLLGLHLGANFYANRTDNNPSSTTVNNAFTVLSSDRLGVAPYVLE